MGKGIMWAIVCVLSVPYAMAQSDSINHHAVHRRITDTRISEGAVSALYVARANGSDEQLLWTLTVNDSDDYALTTGRTALPSKGRYINYASSEPRIPMLGSLRLSDSGSKRFTSGCAMKDTLPVNDLDGVIAEFRIFNRVLNTRERNREMSRLALLYGITLDQSVSPLHYVDSRDSVLWNAYAQADYANHIAGMGNDEAGGIHQPISGSTAENTVLEISGSPDDGDFYVWGDDGGGLEFVTKRGEGTRLSRRWMAKRTGTPEMVTFRLNDRNLGELPRNTIYLAVDESGTGAYPAAATRFYKGVADSVWIFRNVRVPRQTAYSFFQFVDAGEMFAWIERERPSCSIANGALHIQIVGGDAPYSITLNGEKRRADSSLFRYENLEQGSYTLVITDYKGRRYEESFLLANKDLSEIPDWEPVALRKGCALVIDAGVEGADYSYVWTTPANGMRLTSDVVLEEEGVYRLSVRDANGCTTEREVEVSSRDNEMIERFLAYPNPAPDGNLRVSLQLAVSSSAELILSDMNGRVWESGTVRGKSLYDIPCRLPAAGRWILTAVVRGESKSIILIRQ